MIVRSGLYVSATIVRESEISIENEHELSMASPEFRVRTVECAKKKGACLFGYVRSEFEANNCDSECHQCDSGCVHLGCIPDAYVLRKCVPVGFYAHPSTCIGTTPMTIRRKVYLFVAAVGILIVVWFTCSVFTIGSRAEHTLHAVRLATVVVEQFVREHGRWPASWKELESVSAVDGVMYSWPRDSVEIQTHVEIDFDLTLERVAKEEADRFDAIKAKGPVWQAYEEYFASLLATVRDTQDRTESGTGKDEKRDRSD
jgi:hypothetical protein